MFRSILFTLLLTSTTYLPIAASDKLPVGTMPPLPQQRIAFVGNSLTRLAPIPAYGWHGYWGMAATQPDRDYVHRVQLKLAAANGYISEIMTSYADVHDATYVTQAAADVAAFAPSVLVVQMGDNAGLGTAYQAFRDAYTMLRNAAPGAALIYIGVWQADDIRNEYIRQIATEDGATFVPIHDIAADAGNLASAQGCTDVHGVCWHPSDAGMTLIANRVFQAIER